MGGFLFIAGNFMIKNIIKVLLITTILSAGMNSFSDDFDKIFDHSVIHEIEIQITDVEWKGLLKALPPLYIKD